MKISLKALCWNCCEFFFRKNLLIIRHFVLEKKEKTNKKEATEDEKKFHPIFTNWIGMKCVIITHVHFYCSLTIKRFKCRLSRNKCCSCTQHTGRPNQIKKLSKFYRLRAFWIVLLFCWCCVRVCVCVRFFLHHTALTVKLDAQCAKRAKIWTENWSPHTHTHTPNHPYQKPAIKCSLVRWFFSIDRDRETHTIIWKHPFGNIFFSYSPPKGCILCFVYENWIVRQMQYVLLHFFFFLSLHLVFYDVHTVKERLIAIDS